MDLIVPDFHCNTLAELREHLIKFSESMGFDSFGFAMELRGSASVNLPKLHFVNTAPSGWRDTIENAVSTGEPHNMVRHSTLLLPPVGWSAQGHLAGHTIVDDLAREHVRRMSAWNIRSGILAPVGAPEIEWGGLALFSSEPRSYADLDRVMPVCTLYAINFCFWYLQIAVRRDRDKRSMLTNREKDCLQHAANGKTSGEIGIILGISARTVEGYINTACAKLNTRGRQAAISKATELQLIGGRNSIKAEFERQRDEASSDQVSKEHPAP